MNRWKLAVVAAVVAAATGIFAAVASAAAPTNTSSPTISGTAKSGQKLTANTGSWSNSPTSFTYQWQRCASDGNSCGDINGATSQTYSVSSSDVGHALRVVVTAANSDGHTSATSGATDPVDGANGPTNSVRPSVSGSAIVGHTLTVSNGSWSPTPSSFSRQWQRCNSDGASCVNISGATGQSYGVRADDVGHRLRAFVTAHTSAGQTTVASSTSDVVTETTTTTVVTTTNTTTVTKTTQAAAASPSIRFISLHVNGGRTFARFRVCDAQGGRLTIVARDNKSRVLAATHRFHTGSCGVFAKHWFLRSKFRTHGRYVVSIRAIDLQGHLSLLRTRSLFFR
jgi:Ig domain of plant-specific actin-binding protein